jgi:hypothetical protein
MANAKEKNAVLQQTTAEKLILFQKLGKDVSKTFGLYIRYVKCPTSFTANFDLKSTIA